MTSSEWSTNAEVQYKSSSSNIYQDLSSPTSIRLLNIESAFDLTCSFEELNLRQSTGYSGYSALSYRWGDDDPIRTITLQGQPFHIRENLWNFLKLARGNGWTKRLWIDALCINQNDLDERKSQVVLMGEVYSRAVNVLVWLGTLSGAERKALHEMDLWLDTIMEYQRLGYRQDYWKAYCEKFSDEARRGTRSLVRNRYWKRKWIIQEVALGGPNASLIIGNGYIPLSKAVQNFYDAQCYMPANYKIDLGTIGDFLLGLGSMTKSNMDLGLLVSLYSNHECRDPRDHVYALLGVSNSQDFPVDYTVNVALLYWELLEHIYMEKDSAQHLRLFASNFQHSMQISDDEIHDMWAALVEDDRLTSLQGFQFMEAVRMSLGILCKEVSWRKAKVSKASCLKFQILTIDYAQIASSPSEKLWKNAGRQSLMELFDRIRKTHPATLSPQLGNFTCGQALGDYFIGIVANPPVIQQAVCQVQQQLYFGHAALIPFSLDPTICPLAYSTSLSSEHGRRSEMKHLILASSPQAEAELLELAPGDLVCMFSGYQAALVIRRISTKQAICGTAVVKFKPKTWLQRITSRVSTSNIQKQPKAV